MSTRCFLMPTLLAALLAAGCSAPAALPPGEEPKAERVSGWPVAPAPHAPGEGAQFAPVARPWTELPSKKPWSELILGKWLNINREGTLGQKVREFTRDGRVIERYSYTATANHPRGLDTSTWAYHVSDNILFPTSTHDDGRRVEESTTFIVSLTEHELVTSTIRRSHWSPAVAKEEAAQRKVPVELVLAEVCETQGQVVFVRLKDRDK